MATLRNAGPGAERTDRGAFRITVKPLRMTPAPILSGPGYRPPPPAHSRVFITLTRADKA